MAEQPIAKLIPLIRVALVDEALDAALRDARWSNDPGQLAGINAVKWHLQKLIERG